MSRNVTVSVRRPQSTFVNVRDGEEINSDADTLANTGPDRISDADDNYFFIYLQAFSACVEGCWDWTGGPLQF